MRAEVERVPLKHGRCKAAKSTAFKCILLLQKFLKLLVSQKRAFFAEFTNRQRKQQSTDQTIFINQFVEPKM